METITAVGGWGWLFFSCLACYLAWRLWKKPLSGLLRRFNSRQSSKGIGKYAPVWFALFCCGALVMGAMRIPAYPIDEEHNVAVKQQIADNEWSMHSDEEGDFSYRACPDFPNKDVIEVGFIARVAKWEQRGACRSIRATGLGFWWKDKNNQYRRIQ